MRSKKQSAANSEPPDDPVFFIDESLGSHQLANALIQDGLRVEVHRDHFTPGIHDEIWLSEVGRRKWIVLTKDDRIRYRETEKAALLRAGVRAFVLTGGNMVGGEIVEAYRRAVPKMMRHIRNLASPFIATVGRSGTVSLLIGERRGAKKT